MLTPQRWALVIGSALGVVAVVGVVQILVQSRGGFAWVIVGAAAISSVVALGTGFALRRR